MSTVRADFNAVAGDGTIRLARRALGDIVPRIGMRVVLSDPAEEDMAFVGHIVRFDEGVPVASVDWDSRVASVVRQVADRSGSSEATLVGTPTTTVSASSSQWTPRRTSYLRACREPELVG